MEALRTTRSQEKKLWEWKKDWFRKLHESRSIGQSRKFESNSLKFNWKKKRKMYFLEISFSRQNENFDLNEFDIWLSWLYVRLGCVQGAGIALTRLTVGVSRPLAFTRCRSRSRCFSCCLNERFEQLVITIRNVTVASLVANYWPQSCASCEQTNQRNSKNFSHKRQMNFTMWKKNSNRYSEPPTRMKKKKNRTICCSIW